MRALGMLFLVASVACAQNQHVPPGDQGDPAPTVVVTLEAASGPHVWPTARADLDEQRVAFCPARISTSEWTDELNCDYVVGPLWVPEGYQIEVRGDASDAAVERTSDAIWVHAEWPDARVSYRADVRRGDPGIDLDDAADTLRVTCDGRRTTVLTPVVRTSRVGLKVSVEAPDDVWGVEFHPIAWEHGSAVGGPVDSGSVPLEPGAALVACVPDPRSSYWDVEFGTFHPVDPDGLWMTSGVDCAETASTEGRTHVPEGSAPSPGLVERLEAEIHGMQPDDLLRPTRYPALHGAKLHMWEGLVVRDGSRVAVVNVDWDGRIFVEACVGSGISPSA